MEIWEQSTIGGLCSSVCSGGTPSSKNRAYYENGTIPWLNTKEINFNRIRRTERFITQAGYDASSAKWIPSNTVIVAMYGATAARVAVCKIPLTTNQACCNLTIDPTKADYRFVYYYLCSQYEYLASLANGGAQQNLNAGQIREYPIICPDLEIQRKISNILSCIDDKIEINQTINDNLQAQALAIFRNDFLELDDLPAGWLKGSLLDIADYLNGLAMQKFRPSADEIGLPVLKIKELRQGSCDGSSELCSPSIKPDYIVHDGDVIFSWSGSLLVDIWCGGTCGLNQHLFKVTSKNYDKWFYYLWTVHHLERFIAIAADKTTTMGHIKREELSKAEVIIPSDADYKEIGAVLEPIIDLIVANRIENRKLAALRDDLLPKLMSGEIDISNVRI